MGETIQKIYYKAEGENGEDAEKMTVFYCLNSSNVMGYLVAYLTCHVNEVPVNRLVVYDFETNEILAWHKSAMYDKMEISKVAEFAFWTLYNLSFFSLKSIFHLRVSLY